MTHEDFAHICLRIKEGDTSIEIPCCANCKYYQSVALVEGEELRWRCKHPRLMTNGSKAWLTLQPQDFCSRYEERDSEQEQDDRTVS